MKCHTQRIWMMPLVCKIILPYAFSIMNKRDFKYLGNQERTPWMNSYHTVHRGKIKLLTKKRRSDRNQNTPLR